MCGYCCVIDYREGVCGADRNGRRGGGATDAEYTGSSVLTSDERQPLPNDFPILGNVKQAHRDRQRSERTDKGEISSQSKGTTVQEEVDPILPD